MITIRWGLNGLQHQSFFVSGKSINSVTGNTVNKEMARQTNQLVIAPDGILNGMCARVGYHSFVSIYL
jgi:hypothetical protein